MNEPTTVKLDGIKFQIQTMSALKAAVLDRKILAIILPAVSGLAENSDQGLDTEITYAGLLNNVGEGLLKLKDDEYEDLVLQMFSKVIAIAPNKAPMELVNEAAINEIFQGSIMTIYKLIMEVMKHNGFSVFGLAGDGLLTGLTSISNTGKPATKENGKQSEKSES